MMRKLYRKSAVFVLATVLAASAGLWSVSAQAVEPTGAFEAQRHGPPSAAAMAVDLVAVRPLGLVATVLGTGLYVVSLPFSLLGGNADEAGQRLVVEPARATFVRPLGQFRAY